MSQVKLLFVFLIGLAALGVTIGANSSDPDTNCLVNIDDVVNVNITVGDIIKDLPATLNAAISGLLNIVDTLLGSTIPAVLKDLLGLVKQILSTVQQLLNATTGCLIPLLLKLIQLILKLVLKLLLSILFGKFAAIKGTLLPTVLATLNSLINNLLGLIGNILGGGLIKAVLILVCAVLQIIASLL